MSEGAEPTEDTATSERPVLRIITPGTTAEEIAAIVAVFAGLGGGAPQAPRPVRTWSSPARNLKVVHRPGPAAWRASSLPG